MRLIDVENAGEDSGDAVARRANSPYHPRMSRRKMGLIALALSLLAVPGAAEPKGREITYRMTSGGLLIEVEGVDLAPKAEAVKTDKGWVVALTVRATAKDQHAHRLLSPEKGPLMVAAEVDRAGKVEHIGDERKGDGEQTLSADEPTNFTRKINVPIWAGQTLTLHVGLWGLGRDAEEKRPIKKLFIVKMVAGAKKPQPVITAPE